MHPTEAIILAGGLGTRLREAVPNLPKPMAPINGRPFLEHQMDYWINQGIRRFVLSVGFRQERIIDHFGGKYRGCEIAYAREQAPLGTGGGLLLAVERIEGEEPFLAMNGDTFFEVNLDDMSVFQQSRQADLTVALFPIKENDRYMGVQLRADKTIASFGASPGMAGVANGGVYLMRPAMLASLPWRKGEKCSLEQDLFRYFQSSGKKICGFVSDGRFIDIGVPEDYFRAGNIVERQGN